MVGTFPALAPRAQKRLKKKGNGLEKREEHGIAQSQHDKMMRNQSILMDFGDWMRLVQLHSRININSQPYGYGSIPIFIPFLVGYSHP